MSFKLNQYQITQLFVLHDIQEDRKSRWYWNVIESIWNVIIVVYHSFLCNTSEYYHLLHPKEKYILSNENVPNERSIQTTRYEYIEYLQISTHFKDNEQSINYCIKLLWTSPLCHITPTIIHNYSWHSFSNGLIYEKIEYLHSSTQIAKKITHCCAKMGHP